MRSISGSRLVLLAALPALVAASAWTFANGASTPPFGGMPLAQTTGLRLLVAARPPFTLDVDSGTVRPVEAPGLEPDITTELWRTGPFAAWVAIPPCNWCLVGQAFLLRAGDTAASIIGEASDAVPTRDGGAWLLRYKNRRRCTIRKVGADGRERVPPRAIDCGAIQPSEGGGLVLSRSKDNVVLDPSTGRVLLRAPRILAVTERFALTESARRLALGDLRTGARRTLSWPSQLSDLGHAAAQPHGRLIAVSFFDPPPARYLEVWLLDPTNGSFSRLPGSLAEDTPKRTAMSWSEDGRLVLLTKTEGRDALAVWRPGEPGFMSGYLSIPDHNAGSAAMIAW